MDSVRLGEDEKNYKKQHLAKVQPHSIYIRISLGALTMTRFGHWKPQWMEMQEETTLYLYPNGQGTWNGGDSTQFFLYSVKLGPKFKIIPNYRKKGAVTI